MDGISDSMDRFFGHSATTQGITVTTNPTR